VRIVSLCPSLTELVFDLDRVAEIEKVGGTRDPDPARIIAAARGDRDPPTDLPAHASPP
jgi:hypothetical protein